MLFLEACTAVMWLTFGEIGYAVRWVMLYCNVGDDIKQAPVARKMETC